MNNRSGSKENLNGSYFDMTSPLSNLQKAKQRSQLKNSIHNSFMDKLQMYKDEPKSSNQTLTRSHTSLTSLKASSMLYKLPQFTVPQVNYEISQAIKQKANEIKQQMVSNLPSILNTSTSLPSLVPKSSNFNPKKIQNLLGHRSAILQLQTWLRNSLSKNPPTTTQQLIEYKQMIMGVGMKELIRLINSRCLQEGKLVEDVWEMTWGICREIIMHMALRAKKCEQILTQQIADFNIGFRRNLQEKDKQLIQLRKKVQQYQQKSKQMTKQIQDLTIQNQKITIENNKNFMESNYVNEEFMNVLEQNLAMYLHLGDTKKRDWIKKMYKQVSKARVSIKDNIKKKVNKTVQKRLQQENIFQDQQNLQKELIPDEEGNYAVFTQQQLENQNQNTQVPISEETNQEQMCLNLKDKMMEEFQLKQSATQTQDIQTIQTQAQSQIKTYQQKQTGEEPLQLIELGVNTQIQQTKQTEKQQKAKGQKTKNQKKNLVKGAAKNKNSQRVSEISDLNDTKQNYSIPSSKDLNANKSVLTEYEEKPQIVEQEKKIKIQIVNYVCKQCFMKKQKDQAIRQIRFEQDLENLKQEILKLAAFKKENKLNNIEALNFKQEIIEKLSSKNLSDKKIKDDRSERINAKQVLNQKSLTPKKVPQNKANAKAKIQALKDDLNKSIKNLNKQDTAKSSQRSLGKSQKNKKGLQSIQERRINQETDQAVQLQGIKNGMKRMNLRMEDNLSQVKSETYEINEGQSSPVNRGRGSSSVRSGDSGKKDIIRRKQKKASSIIHDIGVKKEIELTSQFKDVINSMLKEEEQQNQNTEVIAKLPITKKEPYFRFFTEQITEANHDVIDQINSQQANYQLILNNYFNIVQEVNSIPESKIYISDKQMLTTIQKNLMPIILELLNTVKKSVFKKNVDQTIKTFHSLPFILMNKFSTKYGVKILAIKNMKLLLSSLKKIQLVTDRYKSLRLMLFTDCRAIYSEDLFVYLLVLALITPHLDIERTINFEQVAQIRQICEKYLTQEKKVYQQFESMTKQALSLNNTQETLNGLKLAPLLRSIITSYRMAKINRIEQLGFVFLMLKKQNYLEYLTFSFFMSCLKIETELKINIVKTFLANCDMKNKNKRIAMSQSGFSRFLIRCPEFNFEFLNSVVLKQSNEINRCSSVSISKKNIPLNKRMSEQSYLHKFNGNDILKSLNQKNEQNMEGHHPNDSQKRLQTQKQILLQSQKTLNDPKQIVQEQPLSQCSQSQEIQIDQIYEKVQASMVKKQKRHLSLTFRNSIKPSIAQKTKHYSYFTYEISRFLENQEETKYMSMSQKQFVLNYLMVHVMACEVEEMIGLIDYFSNDMLEIICCDASELRIRENEMLE